MAFRGADVAETSWNQWWTGRRQETFTHEMIRETAEGFGADPGTADTIASGSEMLIDAVAMGKLAISSNPNPSKFSSTDDLIRYSDKMTVAPPTPRRTLTPSEQKSVRSYRNRIGEHQQKLDAYRKNPNAFDNKGLLRNAPNDAVRQKIIDGRISHLEKEIQTFLENIQRIGGGAE